MRAKMVWLGVAAAVLAAGNDMTNQRQAVLVELFTSEGCSSCPPADALLEKLDREQPVAGAEIIVLSEHMDYWNQMGWKDPYSSAAFTARQVTYDRRFGLDGPYSPQMIVDGTAEFNGSDSQKAAAAIRQAMGEAKVAIRIQDAAIEVDPLPEGKVHKANVYVAYAADGGTSNVLRGENRGRVLHHVAMVAEIRQIGSISGHAGFKAQLPVRDAHAGDGSRLIVFVQEPGNGRVWGAIQQSKPKVLR